MVGEYKKLKSDYDELKDKWLTHDMPSDIKVKFLDIRGKLKEIEYEDFLSQDEGNETSFIDNDDGKTVTIKRPRG